MDFKFDLHEIVCTKTAIEETRGINMLSNESQDIRVPKMGMIVERVSQECRGGIQLSYKVEYFGGACVLQEPNLVRLEGLDWNYVRGKA